MRKLLFLLVTLPLSIFAQSKSTDWQTEAEDERSKVTFVSDGTIDIIAPKGLTLWHKQKMSGNVVIEYDARIVVEENNGEKWNRLSDLNCFWMASDKTAKNGNVLEKATKRKGVFVNQYALQLYYLGYGGNHNSTTRFRRYDGDARGVNDAKFRPAILREYKNKDHLLKENHWYHIRLEQDNGHIRYTIDGECLVDYLDIHPFKSGYFGFRTTLAHAQLKNFTYSQQDPDVAPIALHWIGKDKNSKTAVSTFGVPFAKGESNSNYTLTTPQGAFIPFDTWRLASWPDGSAKWQAFSAVIPAGCDSVLLHKVQTKIASKKSSGKKVNAQKEIPYISSPAFTLTLNNKPQELIHSEIEREGEQSFCKKYTFTNAIVREYHNRGSNEVKYVHTLLVDSTLNHDGLSELSLRFFLPLHNESYKRYVSFGDKQMSVQPLIARRPINLKAMDDRTKQMLDNIAQWDEFRLTQLSANGYSIRKRATSLSPWIGTFEGTRSKGIITVGDSTECHSFRLKDFWQSYPASLKATRMRGDNAEVVISLYSPEAERYSFEHYDTIAHTLEAAYEDIQPGMSTAYGIARTSIIYYTYNDECNPEDMQLIASPEYLHRKKAFGIWSLPSESDTDKEVNRIMNHYEKEIDRNGWYGFFNYGDVMHSYDSSRDEWRYDVGGYAWDNTELGTNAMFWYQFLRTGDPKVWDMAVAMSRHTAEVDCYHQGPNAGLGSRHNVIHWGCGAKEARISQAFWNRFLYYLTADERSGDLMSEVKDADLMLYNLDPMRLAQPRSLYPCTAPARLRVGPDWLAYAGNWFTEWERTGNRKYYDKIISGMKSIAALPHGLFSGPKALGYDPATGVVSWEGNPEQQNTNHLMTIMGGFEMMNEMMLSIDEEKWNNAWLDHAANYKEKAITISKNAFLIPRLQAYAFWKTGNTQNKTNAWNDLLKHSPFSNSAHFFTNDAATWTLDAIFMQETAK